MGDRTDEHLWVGFQTTSDFVKEIIIVRWRRSSSSLVKVLLFGLGLMVILPSF